MTPAILASSNAVAGYKDYEQGSGFSATFRSSAPRQATRRLQSGLATWYGPGFHGRKTASGERFNTYAMTAAHRSLPFGTMVRVENLRSGRSVVVRINDRGPFRRGAVIDLSKASAAAIGITGTSPVVLALAE